MNKVVAFLNANPVQYLATVGRDGKAKCRPFMFAGELDGKLWFCTNNQKEVYKDLQASQGIPVGLVPVAAVSGKEPCMNQSERRRMLIQSLLKEDPASGSCCAGC